MRRPTVARSERASRRRTAVEAAPRLRVCSDEQHRRVLAADRSALLVVEVRVTPVFGFRTPDMDNRDGSAFVHEPVVGLGVAALVRHQVFGLEPIARRSRHFHESGQRIHVDFVGGKNLVNQRNAVDRVSQRAHLAAENHSVFLSPLVLFLRVRTPHAASGSLPRVRRGLAQLFMSVESTSTSRPMSGSRSFNSSTTPAIACSSKSARSESKRKSRLKTLLEGRASPNPRASRSSGERSNRSMNPETYRSERRYLSASARYDARRVSRSPVPAAPPPPLSGRLGLRASLQGRPERILGGDNH